MKLLELMLTIPAEIVAVNVFPLFSARDIVRLDSSNLSHRSRQAFGEVLGICAPVSLQLYAQDGFELEYAAWEWFWKRFMSIIPSSKERSFHEVAKMIGNESLVQGELHLRYCGAVDAMTIARVLRVPALVQKVSELSVSSKSVQDLIVDNVQAFSNLESLHIINCGEPSLSDEIALTLLRKAVPLKGITLHRVVAVTDALLEALMRHAPTVDFTWQTPTVATSLNLYRFYAQCKNLLSLYLQNPHNPGTSGSVPIPACSVIAIAQGCPKLQIVSVGRFEDGFDALTVFASHCSDLQSLECMLSLDLADAGLAALSNNCANFTSLLGPFWQVTNESVVHAAHLLLSRLQHVSLYGSKRLAQFYINNNTLPQAVAYMCELQTLRLSFCEPAICLQVLSALNCTQLRSVVIHCGDPLNDLVATAAATAIVTSNPLLEQLDLPGNGWLSDGVLTIIAASCPLLQELCADYEIPSALTDVAVVALAQGCPKLTVMEGLSGPALTDTSVSALTEHCLDLTKLHLEHSPQVTETALIALAQKCLTLEVLQVCAASLDKAAVKRIRAARRLDRSTAFFVHAWDGEDSENEEDEWWDGDDWAAGEEL
jgi:hypothetical protein